MQVIEKLALGVPRLTKGFGMGARRTGLGYALTGMSKEKRKKLMDVLKRQAAKGTRQTRVAGGVGITAGGIAGYAAGKRKGREKTKSE
ncbi:MAG: hypothetical protein V3W37_08600 [Candidatus Binatia bacterium]